MKKTLLFAAIASTIIATANAANIIWQTPVTISGASDVSTTGTFFGSWAPGNDYGSPNRSDDHPVNGITFAAYGTGANFGFSGVDINMDRYNGFASPNTADASYNYLLTVSAFNWNQTPLTVSWDNMTPGYTYLLQAWVNDGRTGPGAFSSTFTGGANISDPVNGGSGPVGSPGQFIVGTFVADGTTQSFTMSPGIMMNLLQVRTIAVPETSSFALLAVGMVALCGFRRKIAA
jgi:hypothetical protein